MGSRRWTWQMASDTVTVVESDLGFYRPSAVVDDEEGRGLKRAINTPRAMTMSGSLSTGAARFATGLRRAQPRPSFRAMGFEAIDLSAIAPLQSLLAQIRQAARNYTGAGPAIAPSPARSRVSTVRGQVPAHAQHRPGRPDHAHRRAQWLAGGPECQHERDERSRRGGVGPRRPGCARHAAEADHARLRAVAVPAPDARWQQPVSRRWCW